MSDPTFSDDSQLIAGLIQVATALEDEQSRDLSALGKRKRDESFIEQGHASHGDGFDAAPQPSHPQLQNSAAVLFREPSSKSKKHTRPPLGRVFSSLELAPENFLRLQTAAKAFMLDEAHPERRDVVGHKKSSGGADLAKLNLWNCVDEFLSVHGYGEKYFAPGAGSNIPNAPQRTLFWPQDSQFIIKLMMPLMRKMVTNERQRIYAAASRKQGSAKVTSEGQSPSVMEESITSDHHNVLETSYAEQGTEDQPLMPAQHQETETSHAVPAQPEVATSAPPVSPPPTTTFKPSVVLYVNVVSNAAGTPRRLTPRFSLTPEAAPNLAALLSEVDKRYPLPSRNGSTSGVENRPTVKVWLPDGLVTVGDDGEWMVALLSAGFVDWMDAEVRVLVEI
ncbi:hypothetical protein G647_02670 [Cladophialophora carrionii CBS 160.54]|uniref:Uncharacterized protein n=1 Tax=Cladophialophora carrionii CBS 160.54 TaxID=1279043 RepID=V9DHV5_9EURO|nr:uncharacterized protein G647_02670 [Cladophialophora carrionii CBS 160.54]ETI25893.1 hypothetical protein G647_02670 [Cladophialophora carrionii CBS 160.54]